ncbi:MAG TPA: hypothetical protein VKV18_04850 [Chthonomonas sp.]|uniref:hypothetical protein n=1 Tax=Chthonomonas sp. TaxID=2282153 RepID=UPI002B4AFB82|nr:hypothetical protein [Chthonomonas sp.]HLI48005.1 hypothetical protein [Chthonomonas sp.]
MSLRHLLSAFLTGLVLTLGSLGATTWAVERPNSSISPCPPCYTNNNCGGASDCLDCCHKYCGNSGLAEDQCAACCPDPVG